VRDNAPFREDDLAELDEHFLSKASAVIAMQEVAAGNTGHTTIGLRHDCDAGHSLATAVKTARWEADRGYRSTYYVLHTSPYWQYPTFPRMLEEIACLGHEIGIHADALAESLKTGRDPHLILDEALATLRGWGFSVRGVAGHGNPVCNRDAGPGEITFANDEQFVECARPQEGPPDRVITRGSISLKLAPRPLADFGLDYEALVLGLPHPFRFSDSGGRWLRPGWDETVEKFWRTVAVPAEAVVDPRETRQLHLLVHPDWWMQAFSGVAAAA